MEATRAGRMNVEDKAVTTYILMKTPGYTVQNKIQIVLSIALSNGMLNSFFILFSRAHHEH